MRSVALGIVLACAGCWEAPAPPAHVGGADRADAVRSDSGSSGTDTSHGSSSSGNGRGGEHHATKK